VAVVSQPSNLSFEVASTSGFVYELDSSYGNMFKPSEAVSADLIGLTFLGRLFVE
jgi:hypothetical protein